MPMQAFARIPTRPLSLDNKDLAEPKELLADYENHEIYICDIDGKIVNVTASVTAVVTEVMAQIDKDPGIVTEAEIELPSGKTVTIEKALLDALVQIEELQDSLGVTTDETGNVVLKIPAADVEVSDEKQFVSSTEKENWNNKTEAVRLTAKILSSEGSWTSTNDGAPYVQDVSIKEMKEAYYPVVDVVLSEDYETAMKELDSYSYIYKILTYDGKITIYAIKPIAVDLNIVLKIDK